MINELRIYTLKAGMGAEAAKNSGTVGRDIRGDNYGKLEGYWITEIGSLNQVVHLWSYESLNDRARLRAELQKNKRWTEEYIPLIRPYPSRRPRAMSMSCATTAAGRAAPSRGSMRSPEHSRCVRSIRRSPASGQLRLASPTRSCISGPIPTSTRARRYAAMRSRTPAGRRSSRSAARCSTR